MRRRRRRSASDATWARRFGAARPRCGADWRRPSRGEFAPAAPPPGAAPGPCADLESARRRRRGAEADGDDDVGTLAATPGAAPLPPGDASKFHEGLGWRADRSARGLGPRGLGLIGASPLGRRRRPDPVLPDQFFSLLSFVWWPRPRAPYRTFLVSRTCLIFLLGVNI